MLLIFISVKTVSPYSRIDLFNLLSWNL